MLTILNQGDDPGKGGLAVVYRALDGLAPDLLTPGIETPGTAIVLLRIYRSGDITLWV